MTSLRVKCISTGGEVCHWWRGVQLLCATSALGQPKAHSDLKIHSAVSISCRSNQHPHELGALELVCLRCSCTHLHRSRLLPDRCDFVDSWLDCGHETSVRRDFFFDVCTG